MNNIQQERHLNETVFDVIVKISKRKEREKPYNYYHWQDYYELIYVLEGEALLILEGQEYILKTHSLTYITPYELHMTTKLPGIDCKMLVVQFNIPSREKKEYGINSENKYLKAFMTMDNSTCPVISPPYSCDEEVGHIMKQILREAQYQEEGWKTVLRGYVIVLLGVISRIKEPDGSDVPLRNTELNMEEVCKFIESNCTNRLSLEVVANKFRYSPVYFSRLFQQITGHKFKDYIDYILMRKAQNLILNEGKTTNEVAEILEYSTSSSFLRAYKRTIQKFHTVDPSIVKKINKS